MRLSNYFFYTIRNDVKDEDSQSGNLLVRSGMITKIGSGIYSYLPMGLKVLKKIEDVVRDEMNKAGANELLMPSLIPEEYYVKSGRRDKFGPSMFTLKDRHERDYVLGPTHEELFVTVAKQKISSYKDMPFNIYQIATKYRDEARPRYGLIRVREFAMKDAYSFDIDEEKCNISYLKMRDAYNKIFDRLGIEYKIVKADTGDMGGSLSEEYQAVTDIGEDILVLCEKCAYASNLEVSTNYEGEIPKEDAKEKELVLTENIKTINEVAKFLNIPEDKIVKTLIYKVDDKFVACLVKGDREVNELKLNKLLQTDEARLATDDEIKDELHLIPGFIGPIGLELPIVMDEAVLTMTNFVIGANQDNYHYINVNLNDFIYDYVSDIRVVKEGDCCPICHSKLNFKKGIEMGNIFKLGTKYSEALNLNYLNESNELKPVVMGCYGIGIGRIMAAVAEQNCTEKGIKWPKVIAPFEVSVMPVSMKDVAQVELADKIYQMLKEKGIDILYDDRDERLGVKFNDLELIGIPINIVAGRKASENIVEITKNGVKKEVLFEDILNELY